MQGAFGQEEKVDRLPQARNVIKPLYPQSSRRRGEEGQVAYLAEVSERGRVISATLVESSGHAELDRAAYRAIMAARFDPALRNGRPVAYRIQLPIIFRLVE